MFNFKNTLLVALIAVAARGQAQTPVCAVELVDKNNLSGQIEKGHAIDTYGNFTILGSKGKGNGLSDGAGGALLFNNSDYIRTYSLGVGDGLGVAGTVAIDNAAIVLGGPNMSDNLGNRWGVVGVINKNGDTYPSGFSAHLLEGSGVPGTGFGTAVGISNDWIAVGAPTKNQDGGVKMFKRNPSTNQWDDKGFLPLPDFNAATYRFKGFDGVSSTIANAASFGRSLAINNNNLIVGAPGIGATYIYELNGSGVWVLNTRNTGVDFQAGPVAISDEFAGSTLVSIGKAAFFKKFSVSSGNVWIPFQTITESLPINGIAMEGSKLIVGLPQGGKFPAGEFSGHGLVKYYEMDWSKNHQITGTPFWIGYFTWVGNMYVKVECSKYNLKNHKLLGQSVAIQNNMVVAGSPNSFYLNVADGAGFRASFYEKAPITWNARIDEVEEMEIPAANSALFYPNPATDVLNLTDNGEILNAYAVSMNGNRTTLSANGSQIDISDLTSGIYSITTTTATGVYTETVVVK